MEYKKRRKKPTVARTIIVPLCIILAILIPVTVLVSCLAGQEAAGSSSSGMAGSLPPQSSAGAGVLPPSQNEVSIPSASLEQPSSSSSVPSSSSLPPQSAPEFSSDGISVSVSGSTATVTFKTDVESTINAIVATSGEGISTTEFYDYFNRGAKFSWAVSKKTTYVVGEGGKSETYELPDPTKTYYLYVNAVENATGTWQSGVAVVLLRKGTGKSGSGSGTSSGATLTV